MIRGCLGGRGCLADSVSVIIHSQITPMTTDSDSADVKHVYSKSSHDTHTTPAAHAQCKKAWAAVPLMTMTVKDQYHYILPLLLFNCLWRDHRAYSLLEQSDVLH